MVCNTVTISHQADVEMLRTALKRSRIVAIRRPSQARQESAARARSSTGGFAALLPAAAVIPAIRAEHGARGGGRFLSQQGCSAGRHGRLLEVFGFGLPRRGRGSLRPGPLRSADPHVGRRRGLVRQRAAHGTCQRCGRNRRRICPLHRRWCRQGRAFQHERPAEQACAKDGLCTSDDLCTNDGRLTNDGRFANDWPCATTAAGRHGQRRVSRRCRRSRCGG